ARRLVVGPIAVLGFTSVGLICSMTPERISTSPGPLPPGAAHAPTINTSAEAANAATSCLIVLLLSRRFNRGLRTDPAVSPVKRGMWGCLRRDYRRSDRP